MARPKVEREPIEVPDDWKAFVITDEDGYHHIPADCALNPRPYPICGGQRRNKEAAIPYCTRKAGYGTEHVGRGRCKFHGGASSTGPSAGNYKHGKLAKRYQADMRAHFREQAQAEGTDANILDLTAELEVQRHLLYQFLTAQARAAGLSDQLQLPDQAGGNGTALVEQLPITEVIANTFAMVNDIVKTVNSISAANREDAISMAEIRLLRVALEETFERYLPDPETRAEAVDFFAIKADRISGTG